MQVSPKKDCGTQIDDVPMGESASNKALIINQNAQIFKDLASFYRFMDRTVLIEQLLKHKLTYVIFAPSKFGKTVNLNMICFFCDVEDKNIKTKDPTTQELRSNPSENMKVLRRFQDKQYEQCLIFKQEEFVIQHLERHPVIFFEVDSLVWKLCVSEGDAEISKIIRHINTCYNGYYQPSGEKGKPTEYTKYCLFSIVSYLKQRNENKNLANLRVWTERDFAEKLVSLLKKSNVVIRAVQTLLYSVSGTTAIMYQRHVSVKYLLGIFREEIVPDSDITFNFLLQQGLLAHNPEKPEENFAGRLKIHVRIPNLEIKAMYGEMFKSYRARLPETVTLASKSCRAFFKSLPAIESPVQNSTKLQENLDKSFANLKCIFSFFNCQNEASVWSCVLTVLKFDAGYEKVEPNSRVEYLHNGKQNHVVVVVWGKHHNFALILKAKYNLYANCKPGKIGSKTK